MGLFDFFKSYAKSPQTTQNNVQRTQKTVEVSTSFNVRNSTNSYVDASSVDPDEQPFYQPDNYYTYYSYPGTEMAQRVITFDERKEKSYPSINGLYVAEILLLEYCSYGKYPKPKAGYPGLWWFKYGIRDVGHALKSLEQRGFIRWAPKAAQLKSLKVAELKEILEKSGLPTQGKKADLIEHIIVDIPDQYIDIPMYTPKYELTDLGKEELEQNGYVPYMHKHSYATTEENRFGRQFNVWSVNKLFPKGDASNWRQIVGSLEKELFGIDMVNAQQECLKVSHKQVNFSDQCEEMRKYLASKQKVIKKCIKNKSDGFDEESKGLSYKKIGNDKEALVQFYISIGKNFDAPALYIQTAILLRKYGMYEEELEVINNGLKNVEKGNRHREELKLRREKVMKLIHQ